MIDGITKDDWLNTLYMSQESLLLLTDKHKQKKFMKTEEYKKVENDINVFTKFMVNLLEYLKKNMNIEMYRINKKYKELNIDFNKGVYFFYDQINPFHSKTKFSENEITEVIIHYLMKDKSKLKCELVLYDIERYIDLKDIDDKFKNINNKDILNDIKTGLKNLCEKWEKENNNQKIKIENEKHRNVIEIQWIRSTYIYEL